MDKAGIVSEENFTLGQALCEAAQIGFYSAVLLVIEFIALISDFVRYGKRQTDIVDYD